MFNIKRLQDIQIPDIALRQQYYNYLLNGSVTQAHSLYNANPQLQGKCLNATGLNQLLNSILSLQGYFDTGVTEYLSVLLSQFNISIDDLVFIDEWDSSTQYEVNNFVLYNEDIYYCIQRPTIGTLPTDTTYWIYLGLKGEEGSIGLGINYKGAWNSSITYNQYDMVTYQNAIYIAISTNTNTLPTNTTYWFKAVGVTKQGFYIGEEPPESSYAGSVWIKYID